MQNIAYRLRILLPAVCLYSAFTVPAQSSEKPRSLLKDEAFSTPHWIYRTPKEGTQSSSKEATQDTEGGQLSARASEAARQPVIAPGLRLPDTSGIWGLDVFGGTPELVRIRQSNGDLNLDLGHSVKAAPIPLRGAKDLIRLDGYRAAVEFHTTKPVFYVALDTGAEGRNEEAPEDALVVDTHGAGSVMVDKSQQASPNTTYALVRLRLGQNERTASASQLSGLSRGGEKEGSADVIATEKEILPGRHWARIVASVELSRGEYSLVEILPGGDWNRDGWDFGINPAAAENRGAYSAMNSENKPKAHE